MIHNLSLTLNNQNNKKDSSITQNKLAVDYESHQHSNILKEYGLFYSILIKFILDAKRKQRKIQFYP